MATTDWTGGGIDGLWSTPGNWSSLPQGGDTVLITGVPSATVSYDITAPTLNSLTIGNSSTLNQSDFILSTSGNLVLGNISGSTGTYNLNSGDLTVGGHAIVGDAGIGGFNQDGGLHMIGTYDENWYIDSGGNLILGNSSGSTGDYQLTGGDLSVGGNSIIGSGGEGTFTQNVGYHTVGASDPDGNLYGGDLILGDSAGSTGTYDLQNGTLTVYGNTYVGNDGLGTFNQNADEGSSHQVGGNLYVGWNSGTTGTPNTYKLNNGDLEVSGSTIVGNWESSVGVFQQEGGEHIIGSELILGDSSGSTGTYNLYDGILTVSGSTTIGRFGKGTFNQGESGSGYPGGTHEVGGDLFVGMYSGTTDNPNTYNLYNGTLTVGNYTYVGSDPGSVGIFNQTGGTHTIGIDLTLGRDAGGTGTYNLSGGTLTVMGKMEVKNNSTFNYSGGTLNSTNLVNGATSTVNLSGTGTRTINGSVTNNGTFNVTNTTVNFTGTFTNNGSYKSDPSTTYATTIIVGPSGYFTGGAGDKWILSNDFINESTQNLLWSTGASFLGFVAGTDASHDLYIPGVDLGASGAGYTDNFAWGEINIASGNSLVLFDGNTGNASTALYVGKILGVVTINDGVWKATNITGVAGYKIFYDPSLLENKYLDGLTYALNGGGTLSPVPIPGSVILFGSGLLGLIGIGRKRLGNKSSI